MTNGLDRNFRQLGHKLSSLMPDLYRHPDGGLVQVEENRPRRITSAKELAPLLIDHVRISVLKDGKYHGERLADASLNNMLHAHSFLDNFNKAEEVVTTPIVLGDHRPSQPGYNGQGSVLYLGRPVSPAKGIDTINRFLDVMDWQTPADRTNAVAALLTVPFRHHFPGGKPLVLVTATKSHSGKGTIIEFIRGETEKAEILYEDKDWPMQKNLHQQLLLAPEIGVINFDNVRTDSSGRAKLIRSGFVESFVTNSEIVLTSATGRNAPIRTANRFVVLLNTNEGSLSIDLLNRSLPIRLNPQGDLTERISKAKDRLGGDVKHEWLPANRNQIQAEVWGMIDRWVSEGKPLNKSIHHPMGVWAQTMGGILQVSGFDNLLANYAATRAAADPIREALGILAFHSEGKPQRSGELASIAITQGLAKTFLPGVDAGNLQACQRAIGVMLTPYVGETFTVVTASDKITYRLRKENKRWEGGSPHFRYTFEQIKRVAVSTSDLGGLVLEEPAGGTPLHRPPVGLAPDQPELDQYQPAEIPAPKGKTPETNVELKAEIDRFAKRLWQQWRDKKWNTNAVDEQIKRLPLPPSISAEDVYNRVLRLRKEARK